MILLYEVSTLVSVLVENKRVQALAKAAGKRRKTAGFLAICKLSQPTNFCARISCKRGIR